ncbi:MAG: hypothetical protein IPK76_19295 [Lewinellaceae bacterium]|nr:hypothetical protein [Lewinellaceae bacterium]
MTKRIPSFRMPVIQGDSHRRCRIRCGQQNLWLSNYDAGSPIAVLKADGTIRNFSAADQQPFASSRRSNGYKWFVVAFNGGVLVYDSGRDIDNPSDDRYRLINTSNSVLPTNSV